MEDSDIPVEWVKGRDLEEVIAHVENLAKKAENREEYRKILSKLGKKALTSDKSLDLTFKGDSRLFLRHDLPISEFEIEELKAKKELYNQRLKDNRLK